MTVHVDGDKVCLTAIGETGKQELVQIIIKDLRDGTFLVTSGDEETFLYLRFTAAPGGPLILSTPYDWTRTAQLDEATV